MPKNDAYGLKMRKGFVILSTPISLNTLDGSVILSFNMFDEMHHQRRYFRFEFEWKKPHLAYKVIYKG